MLNIIQTLPAESQDDQQSCQTYRHCSTRLENTRFSESYWVTNDYETLLATIEGIFKSTAWFYASSFQSQNTKNPSTNPGHRISLHPSRLERTPKPKIPSRRSHPETLLRKTNIHPPKPPSHSRGRYILQQQNQNQKQKQRQQRRELAHHPVSILFDQETFLQAEQHQ